MFRVIEKAPVLSNKGFGADKRTRTSMKLPSYGPEPYASANSAISALLVEGDGFEPSKSSTADLQSAPFSHSGTLPYWGEARFWSWWADLNRQPADYKSAALPIELHQHVVPQSGIEPPTQGFSVPCSTD